jgi:hypothetical protein
VRRSIQANDEQGRITGYSGAKFEQASEAAIIWVGKSQAAVAAYEQAGGQMPTEREGQRKFPEDFDAIRSDLETLEQDLPRLDEGANPYDAWNQLHDYAADSDDIAAMKC